MVQVSDDGSRVVTLTSTQIAYQRIRSCIVEGEYRSGHRLVEQRLADDLDLTSRTPVREALRMLEADGLVRTIPNRGAEVRSLTVEEVGDLYQLRARLESYAAELAAQRASDAQRATLDAAADQFARAVSTASSGTIDEVRDLNTANRAFHDAILDAAGHERLLQLRSRVVDFPLVFEAFRRYDRTELERSDLFHRLMRDSIFERDGTRAARLMSEHILQGRDVLLAQLEAPKTSL